MNAPFNPKGQQTRNPFAAFVCDDVSVELLKPLVFELGWPTEAVTRSGLRGAVQSLSVSASPTILLIDLSESTDPLNDVNALAEVCEPGTIVIAAGTVNDVRLYRELLNSGIQDYLLKPFTADQVRDALAQAQMMLMGPRHGVLAEDTIHMMSAVIGVRGGVGASTVASSIAWLMGENGGHSTALLDLDVHFGTGALSLDLEPGRGLTDAIDNPARIDGLFLERALVKANDKLSVLSAEAPINNPIITDGGAYFQLQEEMKGAFECTVVDVPRMMMVQHPHLFHDVQSVVLVVELTLAATRDTIRILAWLKNNAPQAGVLVVANRVHPSLTEISRKDFENSIERGIDFMLPYDHKQAVNAAKLGKPIAEAGKTSKLGQGLAQVAERLLSLVNDDGTADGKKKGSLLDELAAIFAPKSKIAKK
ncbi:pilus assembly protein CpaE [Sphingomonadaceae bacterium G21617-S1]|jgi:pilus assembly protein CpaE|uniref:pilus assembly protein CpaE n=1 Tax=Rhizorhabdus sp. TaxID=1968843 RepID=UPI0019854DF9|nr:pilus assembly protein CpaE [Rhizorhabdus sp.]MBD3761561.1 pilus assembly protein CpaE [Rhizorhabdus sp.]MCZ4340953.1 pilus assembly protein CpaE [Sphingomonadaceae bacterium G21617-S1]